MKYYMMCKYLFMLEIKNLLGFFSTTCYTVHLS